MATRKIVVFGDSVAWGQGLAPAQKYANIIAARLSPNTPGISVEMRGHSGAVIGVGADMPEAAVDGEVPVPYPTILKQVENYDGDPSAANLVLLNGGINDIDIRFILSPLTLGTELSDMVRRYCFADMLVLLEAVRSKFPSANTAVVVTGYYPILSSDTQLLRIPSLLATFGLGIPSFVPHDPVLHKIVSLAMQFWSESSVQLKQAAAQFNRSAGPAVIRFALPAYTIQNAVFASDPWLFGIDGGFDAQDQIKDVRRRACKRHIPALDVLARETCFRASAGHPNQKGSMAFADEVLTVLQSG